MSTKKTDPREATIADLQGKLAAAIEHITALRRERDEMRKDFTECCESVENENALIGAYLAEKRNGGAVQVDLGELDLIRVGIRLALG